jgi:hypothetical protein
MVKIGWHLSLINYKGWGIENNHEIQLHGHGNRYLVESPGIYRRSIGVHGAGWVWCEQRV